MKALFLILLMTISFTSGTGWSHGPVDRESEVQEGTARLFVADASNGTAIS